jgi:hypothetical protein
MPQILASAGYSPISLGENYLIKNVVFWDITTQLYLTGDTLRLRYTLRPVNAM